MATLQLPPHPSSFTQPALASSAPAGTLPLLTHVLSSAGFPRARRAQASVARALYGAVLRVLPASAATWFGDLRDRGVAAAVESYTAVVESPALLAAEMAALQVGGARQGGRTFMFCC